ncbi:MAG: hypothetical protein SV775_19230, partial [Thermodesulfobacteriota bacterium]|nr:hypothetical protein [Thermodesulfobacteriota bacterium]
MKGKVERPYSFIREGFWHGYGFVCVETANRDIQAWLEKKEKRIHGTTHEVVCLRFAGEAPHLKALPRQAFDTSYRVYRKVHKDCTVRFESNSYVVPHTLVGKEIILRVKDGMMRIFSEIISCPLFYYSILSPVAKFISYFFSFIKLLRSAKGLWVAFGLCLLSGVSSSYHS